MDQLPREDVFMLPQVGAPHASGVAAVRKADLHHLGDPRVGAAIPDARAI